MTIYVDPLVVGSKGSWCHLFNDGPIEELHEFAEKIGLKRSWFQDHWLRWKQHYDLTASKRQLAVTAGAMPVGRYEASMIWREIRERETAEARLT